MKVLKLLKSNDYLILALVIVFAYWPISFCLASVKWDAINISIPWRVFIANALHEGELPLWYPYQNLGFAQYIDPQTWYYPSWLLSSFGYTNLTFHLEYVLHLVLAAIGFYEFAIYNKIERSTALTIALVYSLSGFFIGNAQHFGWIVSAAWIPIVLLQFFRFLDTFSYKYILGTSLSLYLLTTGGYWGFVISIYYFLIFLFFYKLLPKFFAFKSHKEYLKKVLWRSVLLLVLNITTTSVVLYSVISNYHLIHRGTLSLDKLLYGSIFPVDFLTFIAPLATYVGGMLFWKSDIALINLFIGTFSVLIIIYSVIRHSKLFKVHWKLLVLVLFSLALTMGEVLPLRSFFALYVPLFDYFRFPALFRLFGILGILLFLGHCIDAVNSFKALRRFFYCISACLITTIVVLVFTNTGQLYSFLNTPSMNPQDMPMPALFIIQLVISSAFVLVYLVLQAKYKARHLDVLKALLVAEVIFVSQLMYPLTVIELNARPGHIYKTIKELQVDKESLKLNTYTINEAERLSAKKFTHGANQATYVGVVSHWAYTPYQFSDFTKLESQSVMDSIKKRPLMYMDAKDGYVSDSDGNMDVSLGANYLNAKIDNTDDEPRKLCLSQNYHPGWKCYVNNEPIDIKKANLSLMQISIPKGVTIVNFLFRPSYIHLIFYIALFSFLLQLFLLFKIRE